MPSATATATNSLDDRDVHNPGAGSEIVARLTKWGGGDGSWDTILNHYPPTPLNIQNLFQSSQIVILGDTDHEDLGIQEGICRTIKESAESGVKHFAIELPKDYEGKELHEITKGTWVPHTARRMLSVAKQFGITVHFIDMPNDERPSDPEEQSIARGIFMGKELARIAQENQGEKILAYTGLAHTADMQQIPDQLALDQIDFRSIGVVSDGQRMRFMGNLENFYSLDVVNAFRSNPNVTPGVDYFAPTEIAPNLHGVIMFSRPKFQVDEVSVLTGMAPKELASGLEQAGTSVVTDLLPYSETTPPLVRMYGAYVDPSVYTWEETNAQKIVDFVGGLSEQYPMDSYTKLHLINLLLGHGRDVHRHSFGGSIVSIAYRPEEQVFEFETVDTCGYEFQRENYQNRYGPRLSRFAVDIATLTDRNGFHETVVNNEIDRSRIADIQFSDKVMKSPALAAQAMVFLHAKMSHPESIFVRMAVLDGVDCIRVYVPGYKPVADSFGLCRAELPLDAFELSSQDKNLLAIDEVHDRISGVLHDLQKDIWDRFPIPHMKSWGMRIADSLSGYKKSGTHSNKELNDAHGVAYRSLPSVFNEVYYASSPGAIHVLRRIAYRNEDPDILPHLMDKFKDTLGSIQNFDDMLIAMRGNSVTGKKFTGSMDENAKKFHELRKELEAANAGVS